MHSLRVMPTETLPAPAVASVAPRIESSRPKHRLNGNGNPGSPQTIISGLGKEWIELRVWLRIAWLGLKQYRNPLKVLKAGRGLAALRRRIMGRHRVRKVARVDGRHFWD